MQPISTAYKLAITWGGLRGALTLVLALSVTENAALPDEVRRFVAVLATGLVLFTLLVNGTTLRGVIRLLRLDVLSPIDRLLRDRVLEVSYAETSELIRKTANEHDLNPPAVESALAPYSAGQAASSRDAGEETELTERSDWPSRWSRSETRSECWCSKRWRGEPLRPRPAGADAQRRCARGGRQERRADSATSAPLKRRSNFRFRSAPPISFTAGSESAAFWRIVSANDSRSCW